MEQRIAEIVEEIKTLNPKFLIGTAASAHQTEGKQNNDWTEFEKIPGNIKNNDTSDLAADHYNRYKQDFKTLGELGFQVYRLSIEWSRIFPEKDTPNTKEIEHYRKVIQSVKNNKMIVHVCLHHFTSPIWFMEMGGFEHKKNLMYWEQYIETICNHLGDEIQYFITINEPIVYATQSYLMGEHSPGKSSVYAFLKVGNNMMRAHHLAAKIIREKCPNKPIVFVKSTTVFKTVHRWNPLNFLISKVMDWFFNVAPLKALKKGTIPFGFRRVLEPSLSSADYFGVNYYTSTYVSMFLKGLMLDHHPKDSDLTMMGWGVQPEGLAVALKRAHNITGLPTMVSENGIATDDDERRKSFILDHMQTMLIAMREGVPVSAYIYWSNIDNFEWAEGYRPTFGLIGVSRKTMERQVRDSARMLGAIAKSLDMQRSKDR